MTEVDFWIKLRPRGVGGLAFYFKDGDSAVRRCPYSAHCFKNIFKLLPSGVEDQLAQNNLKTINRHWL